MLNKPNFVLLQDNSVSRLFVRKFSGVRLALLCKLWVVLAAVCWVVGVTGAARAEDAKQVGVAQTGGAENKVFAKVGDTAIAMEDFQQQYNAAVQRKFYHGTPPAGEAAKLQREVAEELIANILLNQEARRLKIAPDVEKVDQLLAEFDKRNANRQDWKKIREEMMPKMRIPLEAASMRGKLEQEVRGRVPSEPSEQELLSFYEANKKLFTEPEKIHVRIILLRVDPSSMGDAWSKAMEQGRDILRQLKGGADFAELAKMHSGDPGSADEGGDLGYLHQGMLPDIAQEEVNKLKPGEVSEPFRGMEGVYLVRLDDRKNEYLHPLEEVRQRAQSLWKRETSNKVWKDFIADLRKKATVTVDESQYLPLPVEEGKKEGAKQ